MNASNDLDAAIARALECVAEWTDLMGRIQVSNHERSAFESELSDAIRGIER